MIKGQLEIQINNQFKRKLKGLIYNDRLNVNSCVNIDGKTYKVIEIKELEIKYYTNSNIIRIENEYDFIQNESKLNRFFNNVGYLDKKEFLKHVMKRFESVGNCAIKRTYLICFEKFNRFLEFED